MKFEKYEIKKDEYGFEFAKNNIMKGTKELCCLQCGKPTKFIEVCSEGHFCSDECVADWYKEYNQWANSME